MEWIGPLIVINTEDRMITVQKECTLRKSFNYFQVKPFYREYEENLYYSK